MAGAVSGMGVSKPLEIPKESFMKWYKYMWHLLSTVTFTIGVYVTGTLARSGQRVVVSLEQTELEVSAA